MELFIWADIMPAVGVVDGVFELFVLFVCAGDASEGGGVGSGAGPISEDTLGGFGVLTGIGPFERRLGDGLGTVIIDDVLPST